MPICDVIVKHSSAQVVACGKIETGAIRIGSKVSCLSLSDVMSQNYCAYEIFKST